MDPPGSFDPQLLLDEVIIEPRRMPRRLQLSQVPLFRIASRSGGDAAADRVVPLRRRANGSRCHALRGGCSTATPPVS